jgi:hypothetical protein
MFLYLDYAVFLPYTGGELVYVSLDFICFAPVWNRHCIDHWKVR